MSTTTPAPPLLPISASWLALASLLLLGWLVYLLAPILTPFAMGALLAYMGDPLADQLEARGFSRTVSVVLVFTAMILTIIFFILLVVPMLTDQVSRLVQRLPAYLHWGQEQLINLAIRFLGPDSRVIDFLDGTTGGVDTNRLLEALRGHWQKAGGLVAAILGSVSHSGMALLNWTMNIVLVPVVTFYLLRDWDILKGHIRVLLPRRIEPTVVQLVSEFNDVLGEFVRGQILVMVGLGLIYAIGLSLMGLDLGLLIGMVAGLLSFVPYLGTGIGLVAALIAALFQFQDLLHLVLVGVVFGIGQAVEGMVLTPLLVGDKIGLHPVAVIFAVLAGGQLFGFLGILLALPVASVIMVLLRHLRAMYQQSEFYGLGGPGDSTQTTTDG